MSSVHDRRRRERWPLVAAALALAALGAPLGAQAADQNTASNGGNGGSSFTARCGAGLALRGVHGRVGDWWDRVQGDCLLVNADGSPAAGPTTTASEGTSSGQVPVNALCPAGQVVSGIGVAARPVPFVGEFVGAVVVRCKPLVVDASGNALVAGAETTLKLEAYFDGAIKPNMDADGAGSRLDCPSSLPAVGIFGAAGTYVDRLGLICGGINAKAPTIVSVQLGQSTLVGGNATNATVTIDRFAPTSGLPLNITVSNQAAARAPLTASVAAGARSVAFTVTSIPVAQAASVTVAVTAAPDGVVQQGSVPMADTLRVDPPTASDIGFTPASVTGGATFNGTISLSGTAPAGFTVSIRHNSQGGVSTASPIQVPCLGRTCAFTANTRPVAVDEPVTFSVGVTRQAATVLAPRIVGLRVSAPVVTPGTQVTAIATLNGAMPGATPTTGFSSVDLSIGNSAIATGPASAVILGGASSTTATLTAGSPAAAACTRITGSLNGASATTYLGVAPSQSPDIALTLSSSVANGGPVTGTVRLASPGTVTITARNATVTPSTIMLPLSGSASFTVTAPNGDGCVMITAATRDGAQRSVMLITALNPGG